MGNESEQTQAVFLTVKDMNNLRHMLGMASNIPKKQWGYRNRFVTDESNASMRRLEAHGWVREVPLPGFLGDGDRVFAATEDGARAAGLDERVIRKLFKPSEAPHAK